MSPTTKAHTGILAANLFFAINISAVKHLTTGGFVAPYAMNVLRVGVSALLFWLLFLFSTNNKWAIHTKDVGRFILCAICGIALNQTFFIKGLSLTFPIHAALLLLITPIIISIASVVVLKESFSFIKIAGLVLGIIGAVILITAHTNGGGGSNIILGDILIILNAITYAAYFILVKPLMLHYNPVHVMRWVFTIGFFMVFPWGFSELRQINWQSFQWQEWLNLGMIVIAGTFFAYLFNIYGLNKLGASITGAYIYTQPVFASIIAMLFLGEEMEPYKLLAASLIFGGVFLSTRSFAKR